MKSLLQSTHNTRDLGGYSCTDGVVTCQRIFLRSDAPKHLTEEDIRLLQSWGIREIIDLRTTEDEAYRARLEEHGFAYHPCRISAGAKVPDTVEAVPGTYLAIAQSEGMAAAIRCIAETDAGVLFHCRAGKDRTGVLAAILLLLAGAAEETVIHDYTLTRDYGREVLEAAFRMFPDANRDIIIPHPEHMAGFLQLFREKYGTVQNYLHTIGLTGQQIASLRARLRG